MNYDATNMVAERGSGSAGPGLHAAACAQPAPEPNVPSFGPFSPGGSSLGRWSQVQAPGNFTKSLAQKLKEWANEKGCGNKTLTVAFFNSRLKLGDLGTT